MAASIDTAKTNRIEPVSPGRKSFGIICGLSALLAALVFRRWLSAEFDMLKSFGLIRFHLDAAPSTPLEWFRLLQSDTFIALLLLNVFDMVNYVLVAIMYLGISMLHDRRSGVCMRIAMALTAIGASMYFTSSQSLNLLSLSNQYFAATDEIQKRSILAAGQFALTVNDPVTFGTGMFWSYMLLYLSGLVIAIVMLRGGIFRKWIAILGIVASAFGLGYFITSLFGPTLGILPAVGSAPCNLVWYFAVGIKLLKSGRSET
jgi:hypothetical protein